MNSALVIFSGLLGMGKSTLADKLTRREASRLDSIAPLDQNYAGVKNFVTNVKVPLRPLEEVALVNRSVHA